MYGKFFMVLGCVCASAVHAAVWQDSFDDNSRDRSIWAAPAAGASETNSTASISYVEQNQRLEFLVSGLTTNDFEVGAWQDSLMMLSAEMDWTLTMDLHNSASVSGTNMVQVGVSLYGHGYGSFEETGLYLRSTSGGLELHESWYDWLEGPVTLDFPAALEPDGSLRISYTATSQTMEIAYANASSSQYTQVKTVDTSGWSEWVDIKSTGFILSTFAESFGEEVASGEVYLDNLLVANEIIDVALDRMFLETTSGEARLSIQLKKSEDLATWTNAGSAIEWVMPVEANQQFFRVIALP